MIVIDAGHGGFDLGGGTNKLFKEKDIALKISLYQAERLKALGIPVSLTREKDVTINPDERAKKILSLFDNQNDLLISNHINIDFNNYQGAEIIYSKDDSIAFSKLIAKELQKSGQNLSTKGIYSKTNAYGDDYYYIIRKIRPKMGVMVEYGYSDNEQDSYLIYHNYKRLAEAVIKAIAEYFGYNYFLGLDDINEIAYIIKEGDSLYTIAKKYHVSIDEIKEKNNLVSDTIIAGRPLVIPLNTSLTIYNVKEGDSLYKIADKFNTTVDYIKAINDLNSNVIYPKYDLLVPLK